jgi:hypothetical protein
VLGSVSRGLFYSILPAGQSKSADSGPKSEPRTPDVVGSAPISIPASFLRVGNAMNTSCRAETRQLALLQHSRA